MNVVDSVLTAVVDLGRPAIRERVAVVVAHPDDETLGCGALLPRLRDVTVVHVTDGAPRDGADSARYGFGSTEEYAAVRRKELAVALDLAGISANRRVCLDVPDQAATQKMAEITRWLVSLLDGVGIVLTHAYEGGHPDHDATAFAVDAACRLLGPERAPAIVVMPFYRADLLPPHGIVRHSFAEPDGATVLRLTARERQLKSALLGAHASQAETLKPFGVSDEAYRLAAPTTDFTRRPNGGHVAYESFGWQLDGNDFCARARRAMIELRMDPDS